MNYILFALCYPHELLRNYLDEKVASACPFSEKPPLLKYDNEVANARDRHRRRDLFSSQFTHIAFDSSQLYPASEVQYPLSYYTKHPECDLLMAGFWCWHRTGRFLRYLLTPLHIPALRPSSLKGLKPQTLKR